MNSIFVQYLIWQFYDSPKEILKGWRNFLLFNLDYFSLSLLLRTFFWHWHKYYYPYGKAFDPWRYFEAFVFNMMSRLIGLLLRTFFIILGIVAEILIFFIGIIIFLGWFLLPFISLSMFIFGINKLLL